MNSDIRKNLLDIENKIALTTEEAGRRLGDVKLLAVSKTYPVETIKEAYLAGQRLFGENKVQELEVKAPVLPEDIEWHLIGHLQSNKVAKAVEYAKYIHSVDSSKLIKKIDRIAEEKSKRPKIFIEVNISGEESKYGTESSQIMDLVKVALECKNLELVGLMTMAPFNADNAELSSVFAGLKKLRDSLEAKFNINMPELSMGMSSDFEIAIKEGATIVRIGTSIFGKRNYNI